jgi:hypothetical protein
MKSKFFTLFAAFVLLFSAQASAQVNGDVNDDGKVNEQDIAAILEIMAEAGGVKEQTKYYWYVGNTSPEGMTPPSVGNANATLCEWTDLGTSLPTTSIKVYKEDENYDDHTWYVAAPTSVGFEIWNATNNNKDLGWRKEKTFMIGDVSYDLWMSGSKFDTANIYLHK